MKAQADIMCETSAAEETVPVPFWGSALIIVSLASWAVLIGAARLIAGF